MAQHRSHQTNARGPGRGHAPLSLGRVAPGRSFRPANDNPVPKGRFGLVAVGAAALVLLGLLILVNQFQ